MQSGVRRIFEVLRSVPTGVLLGVLIAVDVLIVWTGILSFVTVVLSVAISMVAGFRSARWLSGRNPKTRIGWLLAVGAAAGMVAAFVQYTLRALEFLPVLASSWGLMLGSIGSVLSVVAERAPQRRASVKRDRRFRQVLQENDPGAPKRS